MQPRLLLQPVLLAQPLMLWQPPLLELSLLLVQPLLLLQPLLLAQPLMLLQPQLLEQSLMLVQSLLFLLDENAQQEQSPSRRAETKLDGRPLKAMQLIRGNRKHKQQKRHQAPRKRATNDTSKHSAGTSGRARRRRLGTSKPCPRLDSTQAPPRQAG